MAYEFKLWFLLSEGMELQMEALSMSVLQRCQSIWLPKFFFFSPQKGRSQRQNWVCSVLLTRHESRSQFCKMLIGCCKQRWHHRPETHLLHVRIHEAMLTGSKRTVGNNVGWRPSKDLKWKTIFFKDYTAVLNGVLKKALYTTVP